MSVHALNARAHFVSGPVLKSLCNVPGNGFRHTHFASAEDLCNMMTAAYECHYLCLRAGTVKLKDTPFPCLQFSKPHSRGFCSLGLMYNITYIK